MNKKLYRKILTLAIPTVLANLLSNLLGIIDTAMMGEISEAAMSAVSVANKIFSIYSLVIMGLSNGFGIYIGQYSSTDKKEKLLDIFSLGVKSLLLVTVLATAIVLFFGTDLILIYVKNPEIVGMAVSYMYLLTISFFPFCLTNILSVVLRTMGYPKDPSFASGISLILKVVLNYMLVFGVFGIPALGIRGAAIGMTISRFFEFGISLYCIRSKLPGITFILSSSLSMGNITQILGRAFSLMLSEFIYSLGLNMVFINYTYIDEYFIPAITVVDQISHLIWIAFGGLSTAVSVLVGKRLGAGEIEECKKEVKIYLKLALVIYWIGGAILIISRNLTPALYNIGPENYQMTSKMIVSKALFAWCEGYALTVYNILRAGGDALSVLILDGGFPWYGAALTSWICARILHLDLFTTYTATQAVYLFKVIIATHYLKKGKWIRQLTME